MRINLLLFFSLLFITACGLSKQEELDDAITQAHQLLTNKKCAEAMAVLNEVGQQTSNPDWLSAYASAQACLAPWNVVRFFETDLDLLSTADETAIVGSTAVFSQATMTSPTDSAYTNLLGAINTLLAAGGISTISHINRVNQIGASSASHLAVQTLYMMITQIGKYARYYGNADATTGVKGSGAGLSQCYLTYTDADAISIINTGGGFGTCDNPGVDPGHLDLTGNRARQCQGIVLFNNFLDILSSVSIDPTGNNGNIGELGDLAQDIEDLCTQASGPPLNIDFGGTCTVKTQSVCENDTNGDISDAQLERYIALIWEGLHQ